jgi:hypothetical protein
MTAKKYFKRKVEADEFNFSWAFIEVVLAVMGAVMFRLGMDKSDVVGAFLGSIFVYAFAKNFLNRILLYLLSRKVYYVEVKRGD